MPPSEAAKESRKRYLARLKIEDPERYKRYKAKGKYKKKVLKPPYIPPYDPIVVAANKAKRRLRISKSRMKRVKRYLNFIKSHFTCPKCSESYANCLEFHHLNPASKIDDISSTLHNGSIKKLTREILKCVILCANCHRKVHGGIISIENIPIDAVMIESLQNEFLDKYHPVYGKYLKIQTDLKTPI